MLIDSHCHLNYPGLVEDQPAVLARARAAGIGLMLNISTRASEWDDVVGLAERESDVMASVGIHPHEADQHADVATATLVERAAHPRVIGIGETGLDYYYDRSDRDRQRASFRAHIAAARETRLPLIIHTREAAEDWVDALLERAGVSDGWPRASAGFLRLLWQELEIGVGFDLWRLFHRTLSGLLDRRFETLALGHIAKNHEERRRTAELRGRGHRSRFHHPLDAVEGGDGDLGGSRLATAHTNHEIRPRLAGVGGHEHVELFFEELRRIERAEQRHRTIVGGEHNAIHRQAHDARGKLLDERSQTRFLESQRGEFARLLIARTRRGQPKVHA